MSFNKEWRRIKLIVERKLIYNFGRGRQCSFENFVSPAVWWWWWWLALTVMCSVVTEGVLDCFNLVFATAASPGVANSIRMSSSVRQLLMSVISSSALMALEKLYFLLSSNSCNVTGLLWILIFPQEPFIILTLTNPTCVVCVRGVHDERALPDQSTVWAHQVPLSFPAADVYIIDASLWAFLHTLVGSCPQRGM